MPSKKGSPLEVWRATAQQIPEAQMKLRYPLHVLQGEAVDLARFFNDYYQTTDDRPGLESAASPERHIGPKTGEELLSIRDALQEANTAYLLTAAPGTAAPIARATFLVSEISATLEWLFDDGVEDERDAQLDLVKQTHNSTPESHDAWAAELDDWAALATTYQKEMDGLGGFKVALIQEARDVAADLRNRSATAPKSEEATKAKLLRDRLAMLLQNRMGAARSAARFVFRNVPNIAREAVSAYERRRRAEARRVKKAEPPKPA